MKSLCVSLETAKKLKAAGWTKPTELCWAIAEQRSVITLAGLILGEGVDTLSAPTAEEVLRELPSCIETSVGKVGLMAGKLHGIEAFSVYYRNAQAVALVIQSEFLSEAAAQMWLWCVEQGHIKTEVKP